MKLGEEPWRIKFDTDTYEMLASFWLFLIHIWPNSFMIFKTKFAISLRLTKSASEGRSFPLKNLFSIHPEIQSQF